MDIYNKSGYETNLEYEVYQAEHHKLPTLQLFNWFLSPKWMLIAFDHL
jgi:hypothetical protein